MITNWPVIAEAMYFLGRTGWRLQEQLWQRIETGSLEVRDLTAEQRARCRELMSRYSDLPMDLADAATVATGETLRLKRVFTLDHHFRVYRTSTGASFEVVPD